jgi:hypothetical protein
MTLANEYFNYMRTQSEIIDLMRRYANGEIFTIKKGQYGNMPLGTARIDTMPEKDTVLEKRAKKQVAETLLVEDAILEEE